MDKEHGSKTSVTPVRLADHFAASSKFRDLFSYGMDLVEETAGFLDSDGREAARHLPKTAATVYGAESMRLTTRLMQLASWLLLQRAVGEGEMTTEQVISEKKNIKLHQLNTHIGGAGWDDLPPEFVDLVERSVSLQQRIQRLDAEIYGSVSSGDGDGESNTSTNEPPAANHVASQHALLETAFDRRFQD
ncbi:MAG: DUF1465 family protein [Rhizobiaceae bacterium]|nr:DUF1465 family protein [Rhizobiaceae bacterium]